MKLFLNDTTAIEMKVKTTWKESLKVLEEAIVRLHGTDVFITTYSALTVLSLAAFL